MTRILITGAGGFIGSWVARRILERRPDDFLILADRHAVPGAAWDPGRTSTVQVDLGDHGQVRPLVREAQACVHCASCWGADPFSMVRNDLQNTAFLMTEAAAAGHARFIYTSSVNAVGIRRPDMDEETTLHPDNMYSAVKAATEAFVEGWSRSSGLPCSVVRPAYTFGRPATAYTPSQPAGEFRELLAKVLAGEPVRVTRHEGAQFLPVEDLADFYVRLLDSGTACGTFIVAGDEYVTWRRIADLAIRIAGSSSTVVESPGRFPERPNRFSAAKAAGVLGRSFDAGTALREYVKYLVEATTCNTAP